MSKMVNLNDGFLFREKYRVNRKYRYDYDHLASLAKWWEYLDHARYRYTFLVCTLDYDNDDKHSPRNIGNFLTNLRKRFCVARARVPVHSVWKLEYRNRAAEDVGAKGFHYHLVLCFNRDISPSTSGLTTVVEKYWKWGKVHFSETHLTPSVIDKGWKGFKLENPIINTQVEHYMSVFHHLSYLTKVDPKQELPEGYKGDAFRTSNLKMDRLNQHPSIKAHKNKTIYISPDSVPTLSNQSSFAQQPDVWNLQI